jgi:hypothetical protein
MDSCAAEDLATLEDMLSDEFDPNFMVRTRCSRQS